MNPTDPEWDWLTLRWARLRDLLRNAAIMNCDAIVEDVVSHGAIEDARWHEFVMATIATLHRNRVVEDCRDAAIELMLGDTSPLRRALLESRTFLRADDTGRGRSLVLKRGFGRMRDQRVGGTEHRGKTWGRLDQISRELARRQQVEQGTEVQRCTMGHFTALLAHLREHHSSDRNLPRKLSGIKEMFWEFCRECTSRDMRDLGDLTPVELNALPGVDQRSRDLLDCLDALSEPERHWVEVKYRMTEPVELSTDGFCTRNGIDKRRFAAVLKGAVAKLAACLETKAQWRSLLPTFPTSLGSA